jgi:hypothetical protein
MKTISRFGNFVALIAGLFAINSASAGLLYNPVVSVVGDGTTTGSAGVTTSISVYNNSVAAQAAPISSTSYNSGATGTRLVNSFSATSEATLTNNPGISDAAAKGLSFAGPAYVYSGGYDGADGTAAIVAAGTNRSLGQVNVTASLATGATGLQTQTNATAYTGNNIRGATGDNTGTSLYSAGTGTPTSTAGWRNFVTNTQLPSGTLTNTRTVELLGGNLFGSTGSGSTVGIYLLDAAGVNPATPYVTTGTSGNHSPYEFALFDDPTNTNVLDGYNVAYIADDGASATAAGGIEKWVYNGPAAGWTQAYILRDTSLATGVNYRGLAGQLDPSTGLVTLFASTSDGLELQQVTDTGATSTFTTLATLTAANDHLFRGVALAPLAVPEPSAMVLGTIALIGAVAIRRRVQRTA